MGKSFSLSVIHRCTLDQLGASQRIFALFQRLVEISEADELPDSTRRELEHLAEDFVEAGTESLKHTKAVVDEINAILKL